MSNLIELYSLALLWVRLDGFWQFLILKFWSWNPVSGSSHSEDTQLWLHLLLFAMWYLLSLGFHFFGFCHSKQQWFPLPAASYQRGFPGTQKLWCHVCPSVQKGHLVLCCLTCLRASSMVMVPFLLPPAQSQKSECYFILFFNQIEELKSLPTEIQFRFLLLCKSLWNNKSGKFEI